MKIEISSNKGNEIIERIENVHNDAEIKDLLDNYGEAKDFIQKYAETRIAFLSFDFAVISYFVALLAIALATALTVLGPSLFGVPKDINFFIILLGIAPFIIPIMFYLFSCNESTMLKQMKNKNLMKNIIMELEASKLNNIDEEIHIINELKDINDKIDTVIKQIADLNSICSKLGTNVKETAEPNEVDIE